MFSIYNLYMRLITIYLKHCRTTERVDENTTSIRINKRSGIIKKGFKLELLTVSDNPKQQNVSTCCSKDLFIFDNMIFYGLS